MYIFDNYEKKAKDEAEAFDLSLSTYRIRNDGVVVPYAEGEGTEVLNRISNLVTSMGSKILNRKMVGIVGNLSVESEVEISPPRELATNLARDLIIKGSAGLALSESGVYRLGGFIAPVTDENDVDKVVSVFQAQQNAKGSWTARIYQGNVVQEWRSINRLQDVLRVKPLEYVSSWEQVAFIGTYQTDDTGMPTGEMEQLVPILKGIMAVEARIHRVSEIFGFPSVVLKGSMVETPGKSPTQIIQVSSDSDVNYLNPADISGLLNQKKDLITQLDEIAILPSGARWGSEAPSGEAIREVNESFNASLNQYANIISRLLTEAYSEFHNQPVEMSLSPNRVSDRESQLDKTIERLEKGLLPISFVVRQLRQAYPSMTEEEAQEVVESYANRPVTLSSLGFTS